MSAVLDQKPRPDQLPEHPKTAARYYSAKEVAILCKVKIGTVQYWISTGQLVAYYKPGRNALIIRSDHLAQFQERHFWRVRTPTKEKRLPTIPKQAKKAHATVAEPSHETTQANEKTAETGEHVR